MSLRRKPTPSNSAAIDFVPGFVPTQSDALEGLKSEIESLKSKLNERQEPKQVEVPKPLEKPRAPRAPTMSSPASILEKLNKIETRLQNEAPMHDGSFLGTSAPSKVFEKLRNIEAKLDATAPLHAKVNSIENRLHRAEEAPQKFMAKLDKLENHLKSESRLEDTDSHHIQRSVMAKLDALEKKMKEDSPAMSTQPVLSRLDDLESKISPQSVMSKLDDLETKIKASSQMQENNGNQKAVMAKLNDLERKLTTSSPMTREVESIKAQVHSKLTALEKRLDIPNVTHEALSNERARLGKLQAMRAQMVR